MSPVLLTSIQPSKAQQKVDEADDTIYLFLLADTTLQRLVSTAWSNCLDRPVLRERLFAFSPGPVRMAKEI